MLIERIKLHSCLGTVGAISESYRLTHISGDSTERSIDNLISTCASYLSKAIEIYEVEITKEESPVLGCCISFSDNEYVICYVNNLNYCWKRFVVCKEVFHAVLDDESSHNMELGSLIDEITVSFPDPDWKASPSLASEKIAEIAAMEFMFPYASRVAEISGLGDNVNYVAIAEKYKIPLVMVELYLSQDYMDALSI